ncbi:cytochrome P450 716B1-like protein [Tanacetum coccineum]|uniref:Cytochrome P450 716B1-like protein n=1 Tax=Tanacetum coccineum TaxID=301880 RepID=A0ABQ4Y6Z7_9ASTR
MLLDLLHEKKVAHEEQKRQDNSSKDLFTSLLSVRDDDSSVMMSDEEIIDNIIVVMITGYDTTSVLLTFLVRLLANNDAICFDISREQEEISKSKALGEDLTWEDLTKMKYTWRVAFEMLRINPPVMLSAAMTQMDGSIFQNPTVFDPARLEKNTPSPPPFSLLAFGAGQRMCPGMELKLWKYLVLIHRLGLVDTVPSGSIVNKVEYF